MENAQNQRVLTNNAKDKKLKTICLNLFKFKQIEQEAKENYAKTQSELKDYFKSSKDKTISFSANGKNYKVTDVNPTIINWDIDKLSKQLEKNGKKDLLPDIVTKTITVTDWNGFSSLLAKYGVKPKEVKAFLGVKQKVDQKKMDSLSDVGEITAEDIEGCYTVQNSSGYVKPTEWVDNEES
jgi:uncharacterized protein YjhX (UPF0386 family)